MAYNGASTGGVVSSPTWIYLISKFGFSRKPIGVGVLAPCDRRPLSQDLSPATRAHRPTSKRCSPAPGSHCPAAKSRSIATVETSTILDPRPRNVPWTVRPDRLDQPTISLDG
jgi:hypothetical protein